MLTKKQKPHTWPIQWHSGGFFLGGGDLNPTLWLCRPVSDSWCCPNHSLTLYWRSVWRSGLAGFGANFSPPFLYLILALILAHLSQHSSYASRSEISQYRGLCQLKGSCAGTRVFHSFQTHYSWRVNEFELHGLSYPGE